MNKTRKLELSKETLVTLDDAELAGVVGGTVAIQSGLCHSGICLSNGCCSAVCSVACNVNVL